MENKFIKTDIVFSLLIKQLYGNKDYLSVKSFITATAAKKYYIKIMRSIRFAIQETIEITDKEHRQELLKTLNDLESCFKSSKTIEQTDQLMITFQSQLIFLLIGNLPYNGQEEQFINKSDNWKLHSLRQIQYVQTNQQKKNLIFKAVKGKYRDRFGEWGDFMTDVYWRQCANDSDKLIEWLKKNHIDIYTDLF